jgi:hypothetical protein
VTDEAKPEYDLVREIVPVTQLGVGDSVPEHGLVVTFNPTEDMVFVGYGSMRGETPDVETEVGYKPDEMVERMAISA